MILATKKRLPLIFCILLFFSNINQIWSGSVEKQTVLAALTLNVARFTTWPDRTFNNAKAILNLCVFGDNVVQQSFENIDNKVINNKTIHIINLSRLRNLSRCHLLYLGELNRNKLTPLLMELKGQPILTIGENMEFLQAGGMVGLEKINGKIQLSINLPIIKQSELVISSRLLKLANIVDFPMPAH
jgi:hypothetical protein